jgi:uracil phosphoribosyltransferase
VGTIGVENAKRYGYMVANLSLFETLVEHLFYHTMLVYVDGRIAAGSTQINAIREFIDHNQVDLATIDLMSIKKTITRRRKRMVQNSSAVKSIRTSVPFGPVGQHVG